MVETFGQRLRRLRRDGGLSQAELAGSALSGSAVSLLEADRRVPTPRTLSILAERLGCSARYLRDGVEPTSERASALTVSRAEVDLWEGRPARALAAFDVATADRSLRGHLRHRALLGRALCHEALGHLPRAVEELSAIRATGRADEPRSDGRLVVEVALARVHYKLGHHEQSTAAAGASARLADSLGLAGIGPHCEAITYVLIQRWHARRSDEAAELAQRYLAQPIPTAAPERARIYAAAGARAMAADRPDDAVELTQRALGLYADARDARLAAKLVGVCATVVTDLLPDRVRDAQHALRRSHAFFDRIGDAGSVAYCETGLASAAAVTGDLPRCVELADRALSLMPEGPGLDRVRVLLILARAYQIAGRDVRLRECLHSAREMLKARPADSSTVFAWRHLGSLLGELGETAAGFEAYEMAFSAAGA